MPRISEGIQLSAFLRHLLSPLPSQLCPPYCTHIDAVIAFTVVAFYNQTCYLRYFWLNVCLPVCLAGWLSVCLSVRPLVAHQSLPQQTAHKPQQNEWVATPPRSLFPIPPISSAASSGSPSGPLAWCLAVKPTSELIKSESDVARCQKTWEDNNNSNNNSTDSNLLLPHRLGSPRLGTQSQLVTPRPLPDPLVPTRHRRRPLGLLHGKELGQASLFIAITHIYKIIFVNFSHPSRGGIAPLSSCLSLSRSGCCFPFAGVGFNVQ